MAPSRMTLRLLCAGALCLAGTAAHAQSTDKPLGVLILPNAGTVVPATAPVGSSLPDNPFAGSSALPATSAPATAPTGMSARPLGSLIATDTAPTGNTGSVLPEGWNSGSRPAPTGRSATATTAAPIRNADAARPLGTLFGPRPTRAPAQQAAPVATTRAAAPASTTASTITPTATPVASSAPAATATGAPGIPAELNADALTYDRDLGLITATGNVEIVYGDRTLLADKVTYNQKADIVRAEGNVSLTEPGGEAVFGDRIDITGDLKDGVIYNIGILLADRTRIAGNGARRTDANVTEVSNAVYTPCEICAEDPNASPLWQLKAVRVVHNAKEQRVEYRDAWLEIFGVPVAYTPYLSHPDPTVKRRSGFLAPSFSNSSDLGFRVETPYYWAIDDYQDMTVAPLITTSAGKGAIGEYRRNFKKGNVKLNGSFVADDDERDLRGYVKFDSEYHIDPTWRAGLKIETASDDTYTRRYGFNTDSVLVSRAYVEGFRGSNYQVLNAYSFDDLRQEEGLDETPIILPMYDYAYEGRRDTLGGYTSFDFNALNLIRRNGTDTRRLAFRPRWDRPFSGYFGELYEFSAGLAVDGYHTSNLSLDNGNTYSGVSGRVVPYSSFGWRLPLVRPGEKFDQTIEPRISFVVAPNGGNPDKIPNEDSQLVEFDETNLFRENRFDGYDRFDGGSRINYGLNWTGNMHNGGDASFFIGQSYKPRTDDTFSEGSGLEDHFSDIVSRVVINPARYLNLIYRTQFSPDNLTPQRNELTTSIGEKALQLSTQYLFIDNQQSSEFDGREEITGTLKSQLNKYWSTSASARHDLVDSEFRSFGLNFVYEDECVKFTTTATRSFYEDRDLRPSDTIYFTLVLKTLGEVKSGASTIH